MLLHERPSPNLAKEALERAILAESRSPKEARGARARANKLAGASTGHPVYVCGLRALAGRAAIAPRMVGWQYVTKEGKEPIGRDVPDTSLEGRALGWISKSGPAVNKAFQARGDLEALEPAREARHPYEVRVLRIPGLRIEAYWLKAQPYRHNFVRDDFVYPYLSVADGIPEGRLLSMSEFMKSARLLAAKEIRVDHPA